MRYGGYGSLFYKLLQKNSRLIRLPLNKISTINKVNRYYTLLEQEYQREPTAEEIAEKMDISAEDVKENMKIAVKPLSMDAPLTTGEETINLYDIYIAGDNVMPAPETALIQDSLKKDIERSLSMLNEREATIVSMYYGLNGKPGMSLEEIGEILKLTSERVRQVKSKALRKLKENGGIRRLKLIFSYLFLICCIICCINIPKRGRKTSFLFDIV